MTVLEFFDKSSIDNLITTLSYHADKVIYIGYDEKQLKKECRLFEKIFLSVVCPLMSKKIERSFISALRY